MGSRTEQLSPNHCKRGHAKPSKYRQYVKSQTNRKARRTPATEKPVQHRYNGYD